jgi:hypothetical protein
MSNIHEMQNKNISSVLFCETIDLHYLCNVPFAEATQVVERGNYILEKAFI